LADTRAVVVAFVAVRRADERVLLAALRAALPWRVAALFLAVARRCVGDCALRVLVLRALVLRRRVLAEVLRLEAERLVELRRVLPWLVVAMLWLSLLRVSSAVRE
jgi:hypothetical protein